MTTALLGLVIKPVLLFLLVAFVLYPVRRVCMRRLPEGRLKRVLLTRIS